MAATSGSSRAALILNGTTLAEAVRPAIDDDLDIVMRGVHQIRFVIETCRVTVTETVTDRDLADFALVLVAGYPRPTASVVTALSDYLADHEVRSNIAGIGAPTKLAHSTRFALQGLPVPTTIYLSHEDLPKSFTWLERCLDLPFILKPISGSGPAGRSLLVRDERSYDQLIQNEINTANGLLAQQFVPHEATERVLVLGGAARLASRSAWAPPTEEAGEHRPAPSLVDIADVDPSAARLAEHAAVGIGSDVAEVSLIRHWPTGDWYVLDATSNPAIATGEFAAEKVAVFRAYLSSKLSAPAPLGRNPSPAHGDRELG